jgi:hypothetical protein
MKGISETGAQREKRAHMLVVAFRGQLYEALKQAGCVRIEGGA